MSYPPPPWRLRGELLVSAFLVPLNHLPETPAAPLRIGGRALVGVAFARYDGDLAYHELLAAVTTPPPTTTRYQVLGQEVAKYLTPVGVGAASRYQVLGQKVAKYLTPVGVGVVGCWVDSEASRDGGRELWDIPKEMGVFAGGGGIARLRARAGWGVPLPPLPLVTTQRERFAVSAVRGRLRPLRAQWDFARDGPLGWLHGRTPVASLALTDAQVSFGVA